MCREIPVTPGEEERQRDKYARILDIDPVSLVRDIVRACRASGERRADLRETIRQGNEQNAWDEPIPEIELTRDCETRWSSTRLMLGNMLRAYPVYVLSHRLSRALIWCLGN